MFVIMMNVCMMDESIMRSPGETNDGFSTGLDGSVPQGVLFHYWKIPKTSYESLPTNLALGAGHSSVAIWILCRRI